MVYVQTHTHTHTHTHRSDVYFQQIDVIKDSSRLHLQKTLNTIGCQEETHLCHPHLISYSHQTANACTNTPIHTVTVSCVPVAPSGASAAALGVAEALLGSSREWIQLEAPCRKSLSSSAVSLLTRLSVLTFSTCVSVCGSLPGERDTEEELAGKDRRTRDESVGYS